MSTLLKTNKEQTNKQMKAKKATVINARKKLSVRVGSHLLGHELCFYFLKLLVVEKCILVVLLAFCVPTPTPGL